MMEDGRPCYQPAIQIVAHNRHRAKPSISHEESAALTVSLLQTAALCVRAEHFGLLEGRNQWRAVCVNTHPAAKTSTMRCLVRILLILL
jgi:hypothetical protein